MKQIKFRRPFYDDITGIFSFFMYWGVNIKSATFNSPGDCNFASPREDEQLVSIKNHKEELYEGDIIHIQGGEEFHGMRELSKVCVIKSTGHSFNPVDKDEVYYDFGMIDKIELIGNIHTNAYLLNRK